MRDSRKVAPCARSSEKLSLIHISIESIASGKAQMALLGPEGYVPVSYTHLHLRPRPLGSFATSVIPIASANR